MGTGTLSCTRAADFSLHRRLEPEPLGRLDCAGNIRRSGSRGPFMRLQLLAQPREIALQPPRRAAPPAVPQPGCAAADDDARDQQNDDQREQWQSHRCGRTRRIKRVERHRHDLAISDREGDEQDAKRHQDQRRNDLAEQASG